MIDRSRDAPLVGDSIHKQVTFALSTHTHNTVAARRRQGQGHTPPLTTHPPPPCHTDDVVADGAPPIFEDLLINGLLDLLALLLDHRRDDLVVDQALLAEVFDVVLNEGVAALEPFDVGDPLRVGLYGAELVDVVALRRGVAREELLLPVEEARGDLVFEDEAREGDAVREGRRVLDGLKVEARDEEVEEEDEGDQRGRGRGRRR